MRNLLETMVIKINQATPTLTCWKKGTHIYLPEYLFKLEEFLLHFYCLMYNSKSLFV